LTFLFGTTILDTHASTPTPLLDALQTATAVYKTSRCLETQAAESPGARPKRISTSATVRSGDRTTHHGFHPQTILRRKNHDTRDCPHLFCAAKHLTVAGGGPSLVTTDRTTAEQR
ncbi:unnamed protein product, partial [Ectocarpus sp. 8 AP-2014]